MALKRTVDRYRALCDNVINAHQGAALKPSQRLLVRWFKPLSDAIDEEQVGAAPVHASRPHTQRLASSACFVAPWYQVHTHTYPPIYLPIRIAAGHRQDRLSVAVLCSPPVAPPQAKVWSKTAGVDRGVYGPYLVLLPPEILAVLTINEALNVTLYKVCVWGVYYMSVSIR